MRARPHNIIEDSDESSNYEQYDYMQMVKDLWEENQRNEL